MNIKQKSINGFIMSVWLDQITSGMLIIGYITNNNKVLLICLLIY